MMSRDINADLAKAGNRNERRELSRCQQQQAPRIKLVPKISRKVADEWPQPLMISSKSRIYILPLLRSCRNSAGDDFKHAQYQQRRAHQPFQTSEARNYAISSPCADLLAIDCVKRVISEAPGGTK